MRKAVLLYNPVAGPGHSHRLSEVEAAGAVLRTAGVETAVEATRGAAETAGQVRNAIASGCDTVFACGGDGTIHEVAQALAGSQVALGLIPLGTANSLACDLRIPCDAAGAARGALGFSAKRIALGRISFQDLSGLPAERYFLSIAGIGVDAQVFYQLNASTKRRWGMSAYYAQSLKQWVMKPKGLFLADFSVSGSNERIREEVSQILAVRIANFGGALRELAPGASIQNDDCRLVLFRTRSRFRYLQHVFRGLIGANWKIPGIELAHSSSVFIDYLPGAAPSVGKRIFVQADGELLGTLPATISVEQDKLTILAP